MKPVTFLVVGVGSRGTTYSKYTKEVPEAAKIVAAADPRLVRLKNFAAEYELPPSMCFTHWTEAVELPKMADAVIIATPDREHVVCIGLGGVRHWEYGW